MKQMRIDCTALKQSLRTCKIVRLEREHYAVSQIIEALRHWPVVMLAGSDSVP